MSQEKSVLCGVNWDYVRLPGQNKFGENTKLKKKLSRFPYKKFSELVSSLWVSKYKK